MSDSLQRSNPNSVQAGNNRFQFIPNSGFEEDNNDKDVLDPQKIISLILRYKWVVILFLIAGGTGAWFYANSLTPTYESNGTLMISAKEGTEKTELSQIISQTTGFGTNVTLVNEMQILSSRQFASQVADKLIELEPGGIDEFPVLWEEEEESGDVQKAGKELVTSRIRNNLSIQQTEKESSVVELSFQSESPEEAAKVVNLAMEVYVENSTEQNREATEKTAQFLEKQKKEIQEKLAKSEQRLEEYMDSTGIVQMDQQASNMVSDRANLETELQNVNLELETTQEAIANYEKQLEQIKPGLAESFSEAVGPRIQNMQQELAQYERERTLIIQKNPGVLDRSTLPPRLEYLNKQIDRVKGEINDLSSKLFTNDSEFVGMNSQDRAQRVAGIQENLTQLRIEKNQLESRREALRERKQETDSNFNDLPEGMTELAKLQRDVKINEELYVNLSGQHADLSVLKQSQFGYGRIIDTGRIPAYPISPNKILILLLGVMIGGVVSALFITVREFMDNSIKDVERLRTVFQPALSPSVIPSFDRISEGNKKTFSVGTGKVPQEMIMLQGGMSIASESIRRLKNNIIYQNGSNPPKTIAVTSAEKGDGKSTVAANLGVAFADDGYKTLIIDADFRRPKINENFGLNEAAGLSDYLNAQISIDELIQDTDINTLKVITAGKDQKTLERPENIGSSLTFKQLLRKMEDQFDVIILDTPPFGIISDSVALLKDADSTLVVARYRKTNKGLLFRTIEELGRINANVTDIVLNDFDHNKESGQYYGAGYYKSLNENYEAYAK